MAGFYRHGLKTRRVVSDNGSSNHSIILRQACDAFGLTGKNNWPFTPRNNGNVELFIKSLVCKWLYGLSFLSSEERNRLLNRYLSIYKGRIHHISLAGDNLIQQLELLRDIE